MKYKAKKDVLWRTVGDEVVIVKTGLNGYSYLNPVGREIWSMMEQGMTVDEIVRELGDRYEAPPAEIRREVEALLVDLAEAGIIERD